MADSGIELNLDDSKLLLEGDETQQEDHSKLIDKRKGYLEQDKKEREEVYKIRRDFYVGNHAKYTNIVGLQQKEKKGHANAVLNYAGKTAQKIAQKLSNNPPAMNFPVDSLYKPLDPDYDIEEARTQAVEDFVEDVLKRNKFWKRGYRRSVFNQVIVGDFALKVYPFNAGTETEPQWEIKITAQEKMENLMVGWRGDDAKAFDFVLAEDGRSLQSIKDEWGIQVPPEAILNKDDENKGVKRSDFNNNEWGQKNVGLGGRAILPSGRNTIPSVSVIENDDLDTYSIKIAGELVQMVSKDDVQFPRIRFWIVGENIPNPGSYWSISDIDYLIDPNIELNEASNEERDYIRVGANQKYIAYNMSDFDPESVKTGSGGVIFVDSPNGDARFEPLSTNVNTYPADTYLQRLKKHIHDLSIPEVDFGSAASASGRSKALDYQSVVDLLEFKQDSWELALDELVEKIQILGYFYFKSDFFTDAKTGQFKARHPEFDWADVLPITQADKVVTIVNKVQMGLPFRLAFKELGYRDVDAVITEMKKEAQDTDLMTFRSKMWQLAPGIQQASIAAAPDTSTEPDMAANPNAQAMAPTMTSGQNQGRESSLPMSARGGTTSYTSPKGLIDQTRQNLQAQGQT